MKKVSFLVFILSVGLAMQGVSQANWSGSKTLNDTDRVQVIGGNIYVNLEINKDFSHLANIPLSSTKPRPFNSKIVNWNQYGSCPFKTIDLSGYDDATIASGGKVNINDRNRQSLALKLIQKRNKELGECNDKLDLLAKADHEASESKRLKSITLNSISLKENELNQKDTRTYRVATTGKDVKTSYYTKNLCLENCTYTVTTITVMFEFKGNAYMVSKTSPMIKGNFIMLKKRDLEPSKNLYSGLKIIPIDKS